jgi:peptidoglycan hydrolase-like protein with peptidoglycan-binding domain
MKKEGFSLFVVATLLSAGSLVGCSAMQTKAPDAKPGVTGAKPADNSGGASIQAAKETNKNSNPAPPVDPQPMTLEQAQTKLNELGFKVGKIDGVMGRRTRSGLKRFQKEKGISVTGELDAATMAALSK